MPERPNIVLFNPDQWRGDVMGHMGDPAAITPNLDRLVETDAVSFRNAFCQNPVCTPSRCSFMTGWYPHCRGHRTMHHLLRETEEPMMKTLRDSGYHVIWAGKNDLVSPRTGVTGRICDVRIQGEGTKHGHGEAWRGEPGSDTYYSFFVGKEEAPDGVRWFDSDWANFEGALEAIRNRPKDKPFLLNLTLGYPHPPYGVEEPFFSAIDRSKLPPRHLIEDWAGKPSILGGIRKNQNLEGWTEDRWTELRATYWAMCMRVDHQVGLLMELLREEGIADDTGLLFFSDHGDFTGDYGLVEKTQNTMEDVLTRVPLIVRPPKGWAVKSRVTEAMAELIDVNATAHDWAGTEPPHHQFGRSLSEVVAGEETHRDAVFCEGGRLRGETQSNENQSNSTEPSGQYWPRLTLQLQEGEPFYHSKAAMCRTATHKYVRRLYETDELYDLAADPGETVNRIGDPELAEIEAQLKDRLLTWYQETADVVPLDADQRWNHDLEKTPV